MVLLKTETAEQAIEGSVIWPRWRATVARFHRLLRTHNNAVAQCPEPTDGAVHPVGIPVSCSAVLLVVLEHELWKHPQKHPGDEVLRAAHGNEDILCDLLLSAGWPGWRIRRVRSLQWSMIEIGPEDLRNLPLTPMSWVFQLGAGSNRAEDVARGAATALSTGTPSNAHIAAIQFARAQPPRPRAVVMRQRGNGYIVEDGNHFVVALLLARGQNSSGLPRVPVYMGTRAPGRPSS
jgi:hypothetical protein